MAENIGYKYKTIAKLIKKACKTVRIAKNIVINLVEHIQLVVIALKKSSYIKRGSAYNNTVPAFWDIQYD